MYRIAVIGFGARAGDVLQRMSETGDCRLVAVADPRAHEISLEKWGKVSEIRLFDGAEDLLASNVRPDGILIGTRCNLHTELAEKVVRAGVPLFLEKPVCTTFEDLARLEKLMRDYPENSRRVTVSFPLRLTPHVALVKKLLDSGEIGTLTQIQAWNNVYYGAGYYHKWYRDAGVTGGQFLQKATHDFDYINYLCGFTPVRVAAMRSHVVFGGKKPAGLYCRDCDERETCPDYTPVKNRADSPFDQCVFGKDITIEDSDSALLMYENGVHCVYTQNFVARKNAGARGARLIGHLGTLEFDWCKNKVLLHRHYEDKTEVFTVPAGQHHGGGDVLLAKDFFGVMDGKPSRCGLGDGIASARLCLLAKKSAETNTFVEISE